MKAACVLFIKTQGTMLKFYFEHPNAFYYFTKHTRNRAEIHRFRPVARVRTRYKVTGYKGKSTFLEVGCQSRKANRIAAVLFKRNLGVTKVTTRRMF